jgi:cytochrome P450 monooxygenase
MSIWVDVHVKRTFEETSLSNSEKNIHDEEPKTRYVLLNEMAKQIRDPIAPRFHVLNVVVPGRDTSSILARNVLFHLARNPEIWTQLREESLSLGDDPVG